MPADLFDGFTDFATARRCSQSYPRVRVLMGTRRPAPLIPAPPSSGASPNAPKEWSRPPGISPPTFAHALPAEEQRVVTVSPDPNVRHGRLSAAPGTTIRGRILPPTIGAARRGTARRLRYASAREADHCRPGSATCGSRRRDGPRLQVTLSEIRPTARSRPEWWLRASPRRLDRKSDDLEPRPTTWTARRAPHGRQAHGVRVGSSRWRLVPDGLPHRSA